MGLAGTIEKDSEKLMFVAREFGQVFKIYSRFDTWCGSTLLILRLNDEDRVWASAKKIGFLIRDFNKKSDKPAEWFLEKNMFFPYRHSYGGSSLKQKSLDEIKKELGECSKFEIPTKVLL